MKLSQGVVVGTVVAVLGLAWAGIVSTVNSQPPEGRRSPGTGSAGRADVHRRETVLCLPLQAVHGVEEDQARQGGVGERAGEVPGNDPKCINCHATGYGQPTGFKDEASTANLKGTTCEACHGPGSKHDKACKPFLNVKKLSPGRRQDRPRLDLQDPSRQRLPACHTAQGHKEHPKYDKE